jgi:hypothetical protein
VISTPNGIGITATLSQVIAYFLLDQYVAEATKTGEKVLVRVYLESIVALPLVVFQARRTNVKSLLNFC